MAVNATLAALLRRNHANLHIEYRGYLSSHLAHDLLALHALGAADERLERCYADQLGHLEPRRPGAHLVSAANWTQFLGTREHYDDYLQYFDGEIEQHGAKNTFEKHISALLPGLLGSATHPLIHLGFGVEFKNDLVMAEGLAYAAFTHLDLTELVRERGQEQERGQELGSILAAIQSLTNDGRFLDVCTSSQFQGRIRQLVQSRGAEIRALALQAIPPIHVTGASPSDGHLAQDLAVAIVTLYASRLPTLGKLDFFHAHIVTSFHATRQLLPAIPTSVERRQLLRLQFVALALIYVAQGRGVVDPLAIPTWTNEYSGNTWQWEHIIDLAIKADDEHVCKVIHALKEMEAVYTGESDGNLWRKAAEMTVVAIPNDGCWHF